MRSNRRMGCNELVQAQLERRLRMACQNDALDIRTRPGVPFKLTDWWVIAGILATLCAVVAVR